MRAYEFDATAKDGYIRIPDRYAKAITSRVKVIVLTEETESVGKSGAFPYYALNTDGYRFDRGDANER